MLLRALIVASVAAALSLAPAMASANPRRVAAVREADAAVHTAELAGQRLLRVLDEARLARSARGMACVDDKLAQVNSHGRMILARRDRLRAAAERADDEAVRHERQVIRNLLANLTRIEREGRSCVYPEARQSGATIVETFIDPSVPNEDPSLWTVREERRRWARP